MKLGLLQCDHVRPELRGIAGDYDAMFRSLFRSRAPEVELEVHDVTNGCLPDVDACDAFLTTGSSASVYDEDVPWLPALTEFVRKLFREGRLLVGICFGHQMMAHALGGNVAPSPRGWGIGSKEVTVHATRDWMVPPQGTLRLLLSHRDQIDRLPPGASVLAGNAHCPHAIITVGDTFLGIQGHPEFPPAYARALALSRTDRIPPDVIADALPTFDLPLDTTAAVSWILAFIAERAPAVRKSGG